MIAERHPRVGDPAIAFEERGTIVYIAHGIATIDSGDDLRTHVSESRLLWVGDVWTILPPDPPEPKWLHEDTEGYVIEPLTNRGAA